MDNLTIKSDKSIYEFGSGWDVSIFDDWSQFKDLNAFPFHSKGCDLIAMSGRTLWIVEAKDYCYKTARPKPEPKELAEEFALKIVGTLHTIMAVAKWGTGDNVQFAQRALECSDIKVCLAIELPTHKRGNDAAASYLVAVKDAVKGYTRKLGIKRPVISSSISAQGVPWTRTQDPAFRHIRLGAPD